MTTQETTTFEKGYMNGKVLGPRKVGGRYHNAYWNQEYTVLAINDETIVVEWAQPDWIGNRHVTEHATAWDKRDRIALRDDLTPATIADKLRTA